MVASPVQDKKIQQWQYGCCSHCLLTYNADCRVSIGYRIECQVWYINKLKLTHYTQQKPRTKMIRKKNQIMLRVNSSQTWVIPEVNNTLRANQWSQNFFFICYFCTLSIFIHWTLYKNFDEALYDNHGRLTAAHPFLLMTHCTTVIKKASWHVFGFCKFLASFLQV